jgi:hypothetical protein
MTEKEMYILSDPLISPSGELLKTVLGYRFEWWRSLCEYAHINHSPISEVWRYYNDGHQWLFRLLRGKQTIFWMAVLSDTFRVTFYFPEKFETEIEQSDLPGDLKNSYRQTSGQKFRPATILMDTPENLATARKLISLKVKTLR